MSTVRRILGKGWEEGVVNIRQKGVGREFAQVRCTIMCRHPRHTGGCALIVSETVIDSTEASSAEVEVRSVRHGNINDG